MQLIHQAHHLEEGAKPFVQAPRLFAGRLNGVLSQLRLESADPSIPASVIV
jgi:hypothetical protein